ncbi:MAG: hypothetical protein HY554_05965, partial [Elusimicrobia bacterium]|nr:hypothetical protein [Elusimicrobiota bacterium]
VYQIQTDRSKAFALVEGKGPHQGEPPAAEASRVDLGGGSGNAGREPAEGRDGAFPR